ncbi:hypothetical protein Holit_01643 [Hollandina sp. SP2]
MSSFAKATPIALAPAHRYPAVTLSASRGFHQAFARAPKSPVFCVRVCIQPPITPDSSVAVTSTLARTALSLPPLRGAKPVVTSVPSSVPPFNTSQCPTTLPPTVTSAKTGSPATLANTSNHKKTKDFFMLPSFKRLRTPMGPLVTDTVSC